MVADRVTLKKFEEATGVTVRAAEGKIREGVWLEGHEYARGPDGKIYVIVPGYYKWVDGQRRAA